MRRLSYWFFYIDGKSVKKYFANHEAAVLYAKNEGDHLVDWTPTYE